MLNILIFGVIGLAVHVVGALIMVLLILLHDCLDLHWKWVDELTTGETNQAIYVLLWEYVLLVILYKTVRWMCFGKK